MYGGGSRAVVFDFFAGVSDVDTGVREVVDALVDVSGFSTDVELCSRPSMSDASSTFNAPPSSR